MFAMLFNSFSQHPDFGQGPGVFPNDIAIIGIVDDGLGTAIAMASSRIDSGKGNIHGWGVTCASCEQPITLQAVDIPVITDAMCDAVYGDDYNPDVHICVWDDVNQQTGPCHVSLDSKPH